MIVVDPESLKETIATVLRAAGADERNVAIVAEHLKGAELCGVQAHGIFQIPHYIDEIARKELIPTAWPEILNDRGNRATVTGNVGFGHAAADFSIQLAVEKAREHGLTVVGLVRANHIGRLGHYAEIATGRASPSTARARRLLVAATGCSTRIPTASAYRREIVSRR